MKDRVIELTDELLESITPKTREEHEQELENKIIELYENGVIIREIESKLSITHDFIYQTLHRNNIKRRGHTRISEEKKNNLIKKYGKKSSKPTKTTEYEKAWQRNRYLEIIDYIKAKDRSRYLGNKEYHLAKVRQWQEKNKEKYLTQCKKYREKNRQRTITYQKKWHQENKEYNNAKCNEYYQDNKETILKRMRQYNLKKRSKK